MGRQKARPRDSQTWGGGLQTARSPVFWPLLLRASGWESEVWEAALGG